MTKGKHWKVKDTSKMGKGMLGKYPHTFGQHRSEDVKRKISEKLKGRKRPPFSEETRIKMSKNNVCYWKGKKLSEKHKKNIGKGERGDKNGNWQGGKSFEPYSVDWTDTLKRSIRERDHYICQLCSSQNNLTCHHIDYDKKNCDPDNLITLCIKCHSKTNFDRNKWINYFRA